MTAFVGRRFVSMVFTMVLVSIVGFIIINLPPGSYLEVYRAELMVQGTSTADQQIAALEKRYALDKPIYQQYWKWINGFVHGDFGRSFQYNREVSELIWDRLGYTVVISSISLIFSWIVAIPIGIYSATHKYSFADNVFTFFSFIGLSVPSFLIALVLMVFSSRVLECQWAGYFPEPTKTHLGVGQRWWTFSSIFGFLSWL